MNRIEKKLEAEELRLQREELHGKRRRLHGRLSEICEEFVLEDLTPEHKRNALVRELRYLLDFYEDPESWSDARL